MRKSSLPPIKAEIASEVVESRRHSSVVKKKKKKKRKIQQVVDPELEAAVLEQIVKDPEHEKNE